MLAAAFAALSWTCFTRSNIGGGWEVGGTVAQALVGSHRHCSHSREDVSPNKASHILISQAWCDAKLGECAAPVAGVDNLPATVTAPWR